MKLLHSGIEQIGGIFSRYRIFHGFTENYLEGVQPTCSSISYQAIRTYKIIRSVDDQHTLRDIDLSICLEALQMMAPRYKLAGVYTLIIQTCSSSNEDTAKCLEQLELS